MRCSLQVVLLLSPYVLSDLCRVDVRDPEHSLNPAWGLGNRRGCAIVGPRCPSLTCSSARSETPPQLHSWGAHWKLKTGLAYRCKIHLQLCSTGWVSRGGEKNGPVHAGLPDKPIPAHSSQSWITNANQLESRLLVWFGSRSACKPAAPPSIFKLGLPHVSSAPDFRISNVAIRICIHQPHHPTSTHSTTHTNTHLLPSSWLDVSWLIWHRSDA
jgi:hypothetical protein